MLQTNKKQNFQAHLLTKQPKNKTLGSIKHLSKLDEAIENNLSKL
jgi:hypothetical protein